MLKKDLQEALDLRKENSDGLKPELQERLIAVEAERLKKAMQQGSSEGQAAADGPGWSILYFLPANICAQFSAEASARRGSDS